MLPVSVLIPIEPWNKRASSNGWIRLASGSLGIALRAWFVAPGHDLASGHGDFLFVARLHAANGSAPGQVELARIGVEYEGARLLVVALSSGAGGLRARSSILLAPAVARGVVDANAGLHVIAKHVEAHGRTVIVKREGLHVHAARNKLIVLKHGLNAQQHASAGVHAVIDPVLEGQHALGVHVARAGDEVELVGALAGELVANEMAAIVEVSAIDQVVIAYGVPAGGLDHTDAAARFGGLRVRAYHRHGGAAATEAVEWRKLLCLRGGACLRQQGFSVGGVEVWRVIVDHGVRAAGVGGDLRIIKAAACPRRLIVARGVACSCVFRAGSGVGVPNRARSRDRLRGASGRGAGAGAARASANGKYQGKDEDDEDVRGIGPVARSLRAVQHDEPLG